MPTATTLFDFVHLSMPESQPGMAVRAFRKKWIGAKIAQADYGEVESTIAEVSAAWRMDLPWHRPLSCYQKRSSGSGISFIGGLVRVCVGSALPGVATLSAKAVPLPDRCSRCPARNTKANPWKALYEVGSSVQTETMGHDADISWQRVSVDCRSRGSTFKAISSGGDSSSSGMAADDEGIQSSALHGLAWWIAEASKSDTRLRPPSLRCVEDLGVLLASQREKGATGAMQATIAVLEGQSSRDLRVVVPLAVEGLEKWWPVLAYNRPDVGGTAWDETVVELRRSCVGLAHALCTGGHSTQGVVTRWLDAGKEDPMAEIRYAAKGPVDFGLD